MDEKTSAFYRGMRPLLLVLKLTGTFPYYVSPTGELRFNCLSAVALYSLVTQLLVYGALILSTTSLQQTERRDAAHGIVMYYLMQSVYLLCYTSTLLVPLTHWPEINKKTKLFNRWREFETRFLVATGKPLDIDFRRNIILVLLLLNVGIIYADMKQAHRTDGSAFQIFIFIISYHFSCHQLLIMPITWIFYCSGVIKTVTTLSKELEKNISEHGFESGEKLAKYRVLWIQLSRLTQGVGSSMGVTFGWHLLTCLMVQLFYIYYFLSEILRGNICSDISSVVVVATSFLYMECNVAYKATKMVGVGFQNLLQDLEAKYPANNPNADNEIQKFLNTIATNPPVISLCGFATVNRSLLTTFLSILATYIVVIMQFRMSIQEPVTLQESTEGSINV